VTAWADRFGGVMAGEYATLAEDSQLVPAPQWDERSAESLGWDSDRLSALGRELANGQSKRSHDRPGRAANLPMG